MLIRCVVSILLTGCFAYSVNAHSFHSPYTPKGAWNVHFAEKWIRTELYFGMSRKGGADISEAEFQGFVDEVVTPRFPSGLTILDARGQWREDDSTLAKERSKVLVLIYPRSERRSANTKIEEIRAAYKSRFTQQSVLRVDDTKGIKAAY